MASLIISSLAPASSRSRDRRRLMPVLLLRRGLARLRAPAALGLRRCPGGRCSWRRIQLQPRSLHAGRGGDGGGLGPLLASREEGGGDVVCDHGAMARVLRHDAHQDRLAVLRVCVHWPLDHITPSGMKVRPFERTAMIA
jgi:hypothetical protein